MRPTPTSRAGRPSGGSSSSRELIGRLAGSRPHSPDGPPVGASRAGRPHPRAPRASTFPQGRWWLALADDPDCRARRRGHAWYSSSTTWPSSSAPLARWRSTPRRLHDALFGPSPTVFAHVADEEGRVGGHGHLVPELLHLDRVGTASTSRISTFGPRRGPTAWVGPWWPNWRRSPDDPGTPGSSGRYSTGTSRALRFYRSLGARPLDEWIGYRLSGPALAAMAAGG